MSVHASLDGVRSSLRVRAGSWWSWVLQPWRSLAVIGALIGSLALPTVVLASGSMFEASAADSIAARLVGDLRPDQAGLYVSAIGSLGRDAFEPFAAEMARRFDEIVPLGVPDRVLITDDVPIGVDASGTIMSDPRWNGRIFARDGAIEALDVVAGNRLTPGAWVSETLAERMDVEQGDLVQLGVGTPLTPVALTPVAGIYADVWADDRNPYWDDVPDQYVPHFVHVFNDADFELIVVSEDLLFDLGPFGRVAWHVPLDEYPSTYDSLAELAGSYRRLERGLVRDSGFGEVYRRFAADPTVTASTFTVLFDTRTTVDRLRAELEAPIRTATIGGTAAGIVLSTMGAIFLIRRRNREYRLMAADGDGPGRFFGRAVIQFTAPAVAGVGVGVVGAWLLVSALGPSGRADLGVVAWSDVITASLGALVIAAAITGMLAARLADGMTAQVGHVSGSWLLFLLGVATAMWVQVAREQDSGVNPLVVAFPLVGVVTGVIAAVVAFRAALRAVRRSGRRLPLPLFLAWRALTASDAGALLLTAALGIATGLAVLSSVFVTSIDTATEAKAVTITGPATRIDVSGPFDDAGLPAGSTLVRTQTTNRNPGRVEIVAVDSATFASMTWPDAFGRDAAWLVDILDQPVDGAIPAVLVGGEVPTRGEFGVNRRFPYEVVGTIGSVPLASSSSATLVVRSDVFERFARDRFETGLEPVDQVQSDQAQFFGRDIEYESPLDAFTRTVLSTQPSDVIVPALEAGGARVQDVLTFVEQLGTVDAQSTRWVFEFLRILAAIGALTSLGAMALYLSERRSERELASVMIGQMGISSWTNLLAAVVELVGLVLLALIASSAAAVVTATRVFPAFEPDPAIPPSVGLVATPVTIAVVMGFVLAAVAAIAALSQRSAGRTVKARVLRDSH